MRGRIPVAVANALDSIKQIAAFLTRADAGSGVIEPATNRRSPPVLVAE